MSYKRGREEQRGPSIQNHSTSPVPSISQVHEKRTVSRKKMRNTRETQERLGRNEVGEDTVSPLETKKWKLDQVAHNFTISDRNLAEAGF